jgi:ABC-type dipeptide/oligopeptide/nickel transport system permease subunit
MYTSLSAAAILSTVIGAWIGYSFVSMTQERLPRVFDAVHVFFLAFCFYLVNSTLGMEIWWFFSALCLYHGVGLFAVIYNANILVKSLSTSYDWRILKGAYCSWQPALGSMRLEHGCP